MYSTSVEGSIEEERKKKIKGSRILGGGNSY
jgi:hypothetical protein